MKDKETNEKTILAQVASMHYLQGMSQLEIAEKMFFSKAKVSRLIKKSFETGIIEIKINFPLQRIQELEEALLKKYNIKEIIVIVDFPQEVETKLKLNRLAKITSQYLNNKIHDHDIIGLSWGDTLRELVSELNLTNKTNCKITQVLGACSDNYDKTKDSMTLVRQLAEKLKCQYSLLYAPMYVENNIVKTLLMQEKIVAKTIEASKNVNHLITGIGSINSKYSSSSWAGYFDDNQINKLRQKKAVGYICGHFIDVYGNEITLEKNSNLIGISLDDIKNIKNVIAISGGINKTKATHGALVGGYIDVLITDEFLARKLLEY